MRHLFNSKVFKILTASRVNWKRIYSCWIDSVEDDTCMYDTCSKENIWLIKKFGPNYLPCQALFSCSYCFCLCLYNHCFISACHAERSIENCHRMNTRHKHTTSAWRNTHTSRTRAPTAPRVTIQTENINIHHTPYTNIQHISIVQG